MGKGFNYAIALFAGTFLVLLALEVSKSSGSLHSADTPKIQENENEELRIIWCRLGCLDGEQHPLVSQECMELLEKMISSSIAFMEPMFCFENGTVPLLRSNESQNSTKGNLETPAKEGNEGLSRFNGNTTAGSEIAPKTFENNVWSFWVVFGFFCFSVLLLLATLLVVVAIKTSSRNHICDKPTFWQNEDICDTLV